MKRIAGYIVVFLLIGFAANFAVAWGCWRWTRVWPVHHTDHGQTTLNGPSFYAIEWRRTGSLRWLLIPFQDQTDRRLAIPDDSRSARNIFSVDATVSSDAMQHLLSAARANQHARDGTLLHAQAWGWPFMSLYGTSTTPRPQFSKPESPVWLYAVRRTYDAPDHLAIRSLLWLPTVLNTVVYTIAVAGIYAWALLFVRMLPHKRRRRRGLIIVGAAVLGGVVTTVAVSWICAWRVDPLTRPGRHGVGYVEPVDDPTDPQQERGAWSALDLSTTGGRVVVSQFSANFRMLNNNLYDWAPDPAAAVLPTTWGAFLFPEYNKDTSAANHLRIGAAWGYPLRAMWSGWTEDANFPTPATCTPIRGIRIKGHTINAKKRFPDVERALPLGIVWPAFMANSIIYTWTWMALYMLIAFGVVGRARLRQLRGQCLHCAYSLRGISTDRCPECGNRIDERASVES